MVKIYVARHGQDLDNAQGILNGHRNQTLTDLGRQQARDVARKMLEAGFTLSSPSPSSSPTTLSAIYSSPLIRARETAEIFLQILSRAEFNEQSTATSYTSPVNKTSCIKPNATVRVEVLNDLIERDFGIMTGLPASSILEKCGMDRVLSTDKVNYFLDPEGAETFPDLIARAKRLLSRIQQNFFSNVGDAAMNVQISPSPSVLLVTHGDFGKMLYAAYYNLEWEHVLKQFHFGNSEVLLLAEDSPPEKAHVFKTLQYNP